MKMSIKIVYILTWYFLETLLTLQNVCDSI